MWKPAKLEQQAPEHGGGGRPPAPPTPPAPPASPTPPAPSAPAAAPGTPAPAAVDPARAMNGRALALYRRAEGALRTGDRASAILNIKMAIAADPSSQLLRGALAELTRA